MQWVRSLAALSAFALALLTWADEADASLQGVSAQVSAQFDRVPAIAALPQAAAPGLFMVAAVDHPVAGQPPNPGSLGGLFSRRGLMGGFAAGFLGSGLLGLLFGHGLTDELGSVASYVGLVVQLALIAMLAWLIWSWWTGRNQPAFSGLSPRQLADPYLRTRHELSAEFDASVDGDGGSGADDAHPAKPAIGGGLKR